MGYINKTRKSGDDANITTTLCNNLAYRGWRKRAERTQLFIETCKNIQQSDVFVEFVANLVALSDEKIVLISSPLDGVPFFLLLIPSFSSSILSNCSKNKCF